MPELSPAISVAELIAAREEARSVFCHPNLKDAVIALAAATRDDRRLRYGVSPRGSLHLLDAMRALAYLRGRDYVSDRELDDLAAPVLAHRVRTVEGEPSAMPIVREHAAEVLAAMREADGV